MTRPHNRKTGQTPDQKPKSSVSKPRAYLYTVGAAPKKTSGRRKLADDFSAAAADVMARLHDLAAAEGYDVQLTPDEGTLGKQGIFFMRAPEKFAALARKTEGVHYAERTGSGNAGQSRKTIPSGLRKSR